MSWRLEIGKLFGPSSPRSKLKLTTLLPLPGPAKKPNILVRYDGRAVISDFGSARLTQQDDMFEELHDGVHLFSPTVATDRQPQIHVKEGDKSVSLSGPAWTLRWAAPELLEGAPPSLKSDVWALGWICWEVQ